MDVCRLGAHMAVEHSVLRAVYEQCMVIASYGSLITGQDCAQAREPRPHSVPSDSLTAADPLTAETRLKR
jgi:hypothetical protein